MDAYVQIALMEKAARVFTPTESTFLSFPVLTPLAFEPASLAAISSPQTTAEYVLAQDFARIVNFIPRDLVAAAESSEFLWDVYEDMLARGLAPPASMDEEPDAAGAAAQALLYDKDRKGRLRESQAYVVYRQYRDVWIVAQEDYNASRISGEAAADPDTLRYWHEIREPALRSALEKAQADWEAIGRRREVEAAVALQQSLAARSPSSRWAEWQAGFDPNLDLVGEPGSRYGPTTFFPKELEGSSRWRRFELTADEMAGLVATAPPELRATLGGIERTDATHVAFDYRSVALTRPWFQSAALSSRIWRFHDPDELLTDGLNPALGRCPAYVTVLVFVRNLTVTTKGTATAVSRPERLKFTLEAAKLIRRSVMPVTPMFKKIAPRSDTDLQRNRIVAKPLITGKQHMVPQASKSAPAASSARSFLELKFSRSRLAGQNINPAPAHSAPVTDVVTTDATISILAFICKRLGKTPDPQPMF